VRALFNNEVFSEITFFEKQLWQDIILPAVIVIDFWAKESDGVLMFRNSAKRWGWLGDLYFAKLPKDGLSNLLQ